MEHSSDPHTHTITFVDNDGKAYSIDVPCPEATEDAFGHRVAATGAESVNRVAVDGRPMPFEGVIVRLGIAGQMHLLGTEYMTPENLTKLMIGMGTHGGPEGGEE